MFESFWNLTVPKLLIIRDIRLGIINRIFQLGVIFYLIYSLAFTESYYNLEVPRGYITSKWAESNTLYQTQRKYMNNVSAFNYCNNSNHNYIYSLPYWDYRNISCVNLPYSELYEKGENEFFFMTMFTENKIKLESNLENYSSCEIYDRLDGNELCQNYKNYYTVGVEDMKFIFDYKYLTSFQIGGNFGDKNSKPVETLIYNSKNKLVKKFKKNRNIEFTLKEWLNIVNVDLEDYNSATKLSEVDSISIKMPKYPQYRTTGIQIIVNIQCSNLIKTTQNKYGTTICKIYPDINKGWASKGSSITYEKYPNTLLENYSSHYYDRYRYGIKFDFFISGEIGDFSMNNLINTIINAVVLMGSCAAIIVLVISNFCCDYTDKIIEERAKKSDLMIDKVSSCCAKKEIPANKVIRCNTIEV
jgi:hypothetical protein